MDAGDRRRAGPVRPAGAPAGQPGGPDSGLAAGCAEQDREWETADAEALDIDCSSVAKVHQQEWEEAGWLHCVQ